MKRIVRFVVVVLSISILNGCGKSKPAITENTAPFEKAIASYCKAHNYGMKVKKFVSLKVNGNDAESLTKMQVASGTYGLAVSWQFKFKKQTNAKWKAISHETK